MRALLVLVSVIFLGNITYTKNEPPSPERCRSSFERYVDDSQIMLTAWRTGVVSHDTARIGNELDSAVAVLGTPECLRYLSRVLTDTLERSAYGYAQVSYYLGEKRKNQQSKAP